MKRIYVTTGSGHVQVDKTGNAGTGRKIRPVKDFKAFFINFISANKKPNYLVDSKIILIFAPSNLKQKKDEETTIHINPDAPTFIGKRTS